MSIELAQFTGDDFTCDGCPAARAIVDHAQRILGADLPEDVIQRGMDQVKLAAYALNHTALSTDCEKITEKELPSADTPVPLPLTQERIAFTSLCPAMSSNIKKLRMR